MNYGMDIVRGILIGVANVIPGVSGGTMAVSLGVYDRLITSLTGLFKNFKKSLATLVPLFIGMAIGIVGFAFLIEFLFAKLPIATCSAFTGLILGGAPILIYSLQKELDRTRTKFRVKHAIALLALLVFGVVMSLLGLRGEGAAADLSELNVMGILLLFLIGVVTSATMVVPGVSGSMVLMILGYYHSIIGEITGFIVALKSFDMAGLSRGVTVLVPFGIGVLVGIFLIAKLIEMLLTRYAALTYSAILGLIISSPFAIFVSMGVVPVRLWEMTFGIFLMGVCYIVTSKIGDYGE